MSTSPAVAYAGVDQGPPRHHADHASLDVVGDGGAADGVVQRQGGPCTAMFFKHVSHIALRLKSTAPRTWVWSNDTSGSLPVDSWGSVACNWVTLQLHSCNGGSLMRDACCRDTVVAGIITMPMLPAPCRSAWSVPSATLSSGMGVCPGLSWRALHDCQTSPQTARLHCQRLRPPALSR